MNGALTAVNSGLAPTGGNPSSHPMLNCGIAKLNNSTLTHTGTPSFHIPKTNERHNSTSQRIPLRSQRRSPEPRHGLPQ